MPLRVEPRSHRKLYRLVKRAPEIRLRRGQILFAAETPAREIYLVRSGHVRLTRTDRGGGERTIGIVGPWEVFGLEGVLPGTGRRWGARAGESTVVHALPGGRAELALRTSPKTFLAFVESILDEMEAQGERGPVSSVRTDRRLASLLLELGNRFGEARGRGTVIPIRPTQGVLGELIGAHRSTVNTILNDWLYRGLLKEVEGGRLQIARPKRMEELAAGTRQR